MWRLIFILFLFLFSCEYLQPRETKEVRVIAEAGGEKLLEETIAGLIPTNTSPADSATFVEKFVNDWIKKQLMISKAKETIDFNEAQIQQKVLEYQYALMVHDFEKRYIDQNINTEVTEEEITAYYQEKSENFILRQNLAKCLYFKIPISAPNLPRFRRNLKRYPADSMEILDYSNQFAIRGFLDNSLWVRFDEVILETPLKDINDKTQFLKTNSSVETSDEDYVYFLIIFEYKLIGEIAPIEFVNENISDIILNKRKIELKKELEKKIYEEAKASNAFEIYSN
ncbi:MAG: peptidyl-prolyl cis-trans isomerase [Cyclobacteriaceae bacterium]